MDNYSFRKVDKDKSLMKMLSSNISILQSIECLCMRKCKVPKYATIDQSAYRFPN